MPSTAPGAWRRHLLRWTCLLGALFAGAVQAADPRPLPIETFFKRSDFRGAQLSPSGRWLSVLTRTGTSRIGLSMIDLEGREPTRFIEASTQADVNWVQWVTEDWILFTVEDPDQRSNERRGSGLMVVKRDGSESRLLINRRWEEEDAFKRRKTLQPNFYLVGLGAPNQPEVVVGEAKFDALGEYTHSNFHVLNVVSSGLRSLYKDGPKAQDVLVDSQGRARWLRTDQRGEATTWWSDTGDGPWREMARFKSFETPYTPVFIDNQDQLVAKVSGKEGGLLVRINREDGKTIGSPLVSLPGFSMNAALLVDPQTRRIAGVELATDADSQAWFTPAMQAAQAAVDQRLPGRVNLLSCTACDAPRAVLVKSYADQLPPQWLLYTTKTQKLQLLGEAVPGADPARMASMEFHRTRARDGLDLPLWITRPTGHDPKKPAPTVVLVHGGPHDWAGNWGWHPEAQFLASRGYLVVEPDFRGSTGYGFDHFQAGWRQWGLAMQDDVSDALRFAVQQGWADGGRVCIMGASYGGYAALMGLVKDPAQYRCGVAFAAVTDIRNKFDMFWSDASDEYRRYGAKVLVGDPKTDAARFIATSPTEQAGRIQVPVLLAHGGQDRRVPIENGTRMRDALQQAGKPVEWVLYADEGHGFAREANAIDYYRRVEAFLARHLKP